MSALVHRAVYLLGSVRGYDRRADTDMYTLVSLLSGLRIPLCTEERPSPFLTPVTLIFTTAILLQRSVAVSVFDRIQSGSHLRAPHRIHSKLATKLSQRLQVWKNCGAWRSSADQHAACASPCPELSAVLRDVAAVGCGCGMVTTSCISFIEKREDTEQLVAVSVGALGDFAAEEPVNDGEVYDGEYGTDEPPGEADS